MDKIRLNQMMFYGYHGVFPEENRLGQTFMVDLELQLDLRPAGMQDDLTQSVDYAEVFRMTEQIVEGKAYQLIEAVAEQIASACLNQFPIDEVKVCVTKPNPPIKGHYQSVAIEIIRRRNG